ncbi:N-acetyltransferase [Photobacterium kishitanii]|uniref:N-acetyltransferase n=1 Tax=Photobacterium kishitanii TaxID=318456 RepID=UPI000D172AAE|nr:N-acetyltransferase [Photobacterium kishitanii]PSU20606.1 N-acetyltransferase [Photobacterium kishitanii]
MHFRYVFFRDINLSDPFFDSLKADYAEFVDWFSRKANEKAYIFVDDNNYCQGFLYLKIEDEEISDVTPTLQAKRRIKIGTLKINAHGTRMGERFIKKALDFAMYNSVDEVYVTIFSHHEGLVRIFNTYGFNYAAQKTTINGTELVLLKSLRALNHTVKSSYPLVNANSRKFLLSLYPQWHSRLLPDSILHTEDPQEIITDVSYTNSINKIYLTAMRGTEHLQSGDLLLIYRTSDQPNNAYHRSVVTSVCVVDEVRNIADFPTIDDFLRYSLSYSIFSEFELRQFYASRQYPVVIRFTYNFALNRRVNRAYMIENLGLPPRAYTGFMEISDSLFMGVLEQGNSNEGFIVN